VDLPGQVEAGAVDLQPAIVVSLEDARAAGGTFERGDDHQAGGGTSKRPPSRGVRLQLSPAVAHVVEGVGLPPQTLHLLLHPAGCFGLIDGHVVVQSFTKVQS